MTNVTEKMLVQVKERRDIAQAEKETAQLTIDTCDVYLQANCFHPPYHRQTTYSMENYFSTEKGFYVFEAVDRCKLCGYQTRKEIPV